MADSAASRPTLLQTLEREFRLIEEMDPSLEDGGHMVYDREVPVELRSMDDEDAGALEGLKIKVVVFGDDNSPSSVRLEISSEAELFFHYTCVINAQGFLQLREDQKLTCEFRDFPITLTKMFNQAIREPNTFLVVLLLGRDRNSTLQIIQNMEFKFVELLAMPLRESEEAKIKAHITYRYNAMRSRLSIMTAKLQDVSALVKVRDPAVKRELWEGREADVKFR
jgi:hypothetical protein